MLIFSFTVFVSGVAAQEKQAETEKSKAPKEAPIVVEEEILTLLKDEPTYHFLRAKTEFIRRDFKESANEILKGSAIIKLQAANAQGKLKMELEKSALELDSLAAELKAGKVNSIKALDSSFARAEFALAAQYEAEANESWVAKETKETGYYLEAAVTHLERAADWSGHKLEEVTISLFDEVRVIAGKLIDGTGEVPKEVGAAIDDIGKEIQKFGKIIEPNKKNE